MKHLKRVLYGPTKGDIDLTDGRARVEESLPQTAISLESRLRFFKGAWFIDQNEGIPYFAVFLGKGRSPALIEAMLTQAIETHPDVVGVRFVTVSLPEQHTRRANVSFGAQSQLGSIGPADPLILGD
jgi:hypothetical protein